jgi:hypothetical protein
VFDLVLGRSPDKVEGPYYKKGLNGSFGFQNPNKFYISKECGELEDPSKNVPNYYRETEDSMEF